MLSQSSIVVHLMMGLGAMAHLLICLKKKKTIERHEAALAAICFFFFASKVIILGRMYCDHLFLDVLNVSVQ